VTIVHIRGEDTPSLKDVVGMLRRLADKIESGEHGEVNSVFVVVPSAQEDFPKVFAFGDVDGNNNPYIQLDLAKQLLLNNLVVRD
jgi:hypothetical protein